MAREDALERAVQERQPQRVGLDEAGVRHPRARELEHRGALVEPVISPGRCCVRKPVPHATSSVRAAEATITSISASRASSQPGRSRCSNRPVPSHQSSYSGARAS